MTQWEYKIAWIYPHITGKWHTEPNVEELDELGAQGWELVHMENKGAGWDAVLKRPISVTVQCEKM